MAARPPKPGSCSRRGLRVPLASILRCGALTRGSAAAPNAVSWPCGTSGRRCSVLRPALCVDGPVGPGTTRSAGDVPIPIPKSPSAAGSGGHVGSRRAQDAPADGPWGRYSDVRVRCPGHRNFRTSELRKRARARERPQGDSPWAAEQRPFARGRDRARYPALSRRDRLARGTRVDRPRWIHRAELAGRRDRTDATMPGPEIRDVGRQAGR